MVVGVIGLGTVGYGVVDILTKERSRLKDYLQEDIYVKYGCSLEDVDLPEGVIHTTNYKDVINDEDVDVIVELIGGLTIAKRIISEAIEAKKHVVTANKALIAHYGKELLIKANQNDVHVFYEAAVGGGIPVLTPQFEMLRGNNISEISGILNGTTNFILSLMETDNLDFDQAMTIADGLGFLEADPSLDIDGIDTAHKIAILANNSFDGFVDFDKIKPIGIRNVSKADMDFAKKLGYRIKLLATCKKDKDNYYIDICPTLVNLNSMISNVMQAYNVVEISGDYVDNVLFYGKGAGRYVTASAVVGDILKCKQDFKWKYKDRVISSILPITKSRYFVRSHTDLDIDYEYYYSERNEHIYITREMEYATLIAQLGDEENYSIYKVRD